MDPQWHQSVTNITNKTRASNYCTSITLWPSQVILSSNLNIICNNITIFMYLTSYKTTTNSKTSFIYKLLISRCHKIIAKAFYSTNPLPILSSLIMYNHQFITLRLLQNQPSPQRFVPNPLFPRTPATLLI